MTHRPAALVSAAILVATLLAACAPEEPAVEFIAVPTQSPRPANEGVPPACPGALLEGTLLGDEEHGFVVRHDDPIPPVVVVWPHGWIAVETDGVRLLLNEQGRSVAREGDRFSAGGGFSSPDDWFHPCGEITFTAGGAGG